MPLVRFEAKNEYGLGDPLLYREAEKDGPKALLEGVAIAGLVGIIRQLGDLSDFAAEIFHDLHEQVIATAERGQDIMLRIQQIEAELPSLETAALAQTSHIHFAYNPGSDWHATVRTEENHLTRGDLPGFIMDAYEESRGPPRLFLLDKFDVAGTGACLKRYSDPSFFKMEWATSELLKAEKFKQERKILRKKSRKRRSVEALDAGSLSGAHTSDQNPSGENISTVMKSKSSSTSQLLSSSTKISYMEPLLDINVPSECAKVETVFLDTAITDSQCINVVTSVISEHQAKPDIDNEFLCESSHRGKIPESAPFIGAENIELISAQNNSGFHVVEDENQATAAVTEGFSEFHVEQTASTPSNVAQHTVLVDENKPVSSSGESQDNEVASELDSYADALNSMESEVETDSENRLMEEMEFQHADKEPEVKSGKKQKELPPCTSNCSDLETGSGPSESSSQVDLEDYNVPGSAVLTVFESEACTSPNDETAKEIICSSIENNNVACPVILDEQFPVGNSHESVPGKFCHATSAYSCPSDGLLGVEPPEHLDFIPGDGCKTQGHPSVPIIVQSFTTDGPVVQEKKPKPGTVLNMPPENVIPTDVSDLNPNKVGQEKTLLVESFEFQIQHVKQYEEFSKENSMDLTILESSMEFDNYNKINEEKVREADVLPCDRELPSPSKVGVQSDVSISEDGCLDNGFEKEKAASKQLSNKSSDINNCENLSDEAGREDTPKEQEAGGLVQSAFADMDSRSVFLEQPSSEPESPRHSPSSRSHHSDCSSPPLEHMKISFHPINDMDASTLNVDCPDEHNFDESVRDAFDSSFHHIPECMIPLGEIDKRGSTDELSFIPCNWSMHSISMFEEPVTPKEVDSEIYSDDDASCKPSLNFSEDMLSQGSEPNSEQWECSKLNGQKDALCDSLHIVSPSNSFSSSLGMEKASNHPTDCPCETKDAGTLNCSRSRTSSTAGSVDLLASGLQISQMNLQEKESNPNQKLGSVSPKTAVIPPVPPPPPQWGYRKSLIPAVQGQKSHQTVSTRQPTDVQTLEHVSTDQLKPSVPLSPKESIASHDIIIRKPKTLNRSPQIQQQSGRELLLEQIRTKSFSLRRTVTTRSSLFVPRPATNINVAAILEKANAIRQAFAGSDNESDDDANWSDD
ncbi:protein SCAR3-like isoform X2 [Nymphaea colorata]|uniref:protein SCAR3-like isoform X2 n=1 Tax=Nymphaea colorata TaxID=210225 RepID=UPI00214F3DBC|nr:protein SCAR3-like isoform X2 [Nymphaea colorata]